MCGRFNITDMPGLQSLLDHLGIDLKLPEHATTEFYPISTEQSRHHLLKPATVRPGDLWWWRPCTADIRADHASAPRGCAGGPQREPAPYPPLGPSPRPGGYGWQAARLFSDYQAGPGDGVVMMVVPPDSRKPLVCQCIDHRRVIGMHNPTG